MDHRNIDYADLYFQLSQDESWVLEDGIIKEGGFHIDRGVGVRAVSGENGVCLCRSNRSCQLAAMCQCGQGHCSNNSAKFYPASLLFYDAAYSALSAD